MFVVFHILHYVNKPYTGGQDAHPTRKFILCGTGILPVNDRIETHPKKITLCGTGILPVADRIEAHQKKITLCGTGILPVADKIETHPTKTLLKTI